MTYALTPVEKLSPGGPARVREIYESGFAEHLRAPWAEAGSDRLASEESLALTDDGTPVGFVLLRSFVTTDRVFLRYLVIDADRRGQGLGSIAWQHLRRHCVREDFSVLVWDVEHPEEPGTDATEVTTRRKRIGFYERLGGVVLPVDDYTTPHGEPDDAHEAPMLLMATSLDDSALPVHDAAWVDGVVRDVNRHRWGR